MRAANFKNTQSTAPGFHKLFFVMIKNEKSHIVIGVSSTTHYNEMT